MQRRYTRTGGSTIGECCSQQISGVLAMAELAVVSARRARLRTRSVDGERDRDNRYDENSDRGRNHREGLHGAGG